MQIRTVLIEKDPGQLTEIENLLAFYRAFDIVGTFDDIDAAGRFLMEEDVDAVFIRSDVGDPRRTPDGSFLLSYVTRKKPDLLAVLYCDSQDIAFWAMTAGATAAFTTPIDPQMFQRAVERVLYVYDLLQYKRDAKARSIMVKTKDGYRMLRLSEILFIERRERKKYIVCADGCEVTVSNYSMDDLDAMLSTSHFYRCYSSFIINLERVERININNDKKLYSITLDGFDGEIILSREKYKELMAVLKKKYSDLTL